MSKPTNMNELPKIQDLLKEPEKMRVMCAEACGTAERYAVIKAGLYYRPNACGYTNRIEEAGIYTKASAEREVVSGEPMDIRLMPPPKYDTSLDAMAEAEATLTDEEYRAYAKLFIQQAETSGRSAENKSRMIISAHAIDRLVNFLIAKGLAQP